MPLTPDEFRRALSGLAAGVCVVTVRDAAPGGTGRAMGMTATSVASLSLQPPLVLVCVGHAALMHETIVQAGHFGIVMLAAAQPDLAVRFATRGQQDFDGSEAVTPAGLPRIAGALGTLDCRRYDLLPGGDHTIVVGQVEWADVAAGEPLLYWRGRYGSVAP